MNSSTFSFAPAAFVPFRDRRVLRRVRSIRREDIETHPNPDFHIRVVRDMQMGVLQLTDQFYRLKTAMDAGEEVCFILPNPNPAYLHLAGLINRFGVHCRKFWIGDNSHRAFPI